MFLQTDSEGRRRRSEGERMGRGGRAEQRQKQGGRGEKKKNVRKRENRSVALNP